MSDIQIRTTGTTEVVQSSDDRITLLVPIQVKRRSGRKQMTLPGEEPGQPSKLLRPWDEAILEDALPDHLTPFDIAVNPPALWADQRSILTAAKRSKS